MRIGRLRKRVTLQRVADGSVDAMGAPAPAWSNVATLWAAVVPMSGQERFQNAQVTPEATHKITLRYRSDITTRDRLVYDGRTFEIVQAINLREQGAELELMCKEAV